MSTFIIRSQGFFYTDEYFAPGEVFKQVVKKRFSTKAAADKACAALVRKWVRSEPIGNYVFDDGEAIEAIEKYLRKEWPDAFSRRKDLFLGDVEIPAEATDQQVDAIVQRMGVVFAEVFEVDEDEDDGDDDDDDDEGYEDDLHFGPT